MIFVKFIVLLLLVFILISLFAGLYFLVKDKGQTKRTVNALTIRIGLSVLAIVIILIAAATGVIEINRNPMMNDPQTDLKTDSTIVSKSDEKPAATDSGNTQ